MCVGVCVCKYLQHIYDQVGYPANTAERCHIKIHNEVLPKQYLCGVTVPDVAEWNWLCIKDVFVPSYIFLHPQSGQMILE